jgi:hypothetical protein
MKRLLTTVAIALLAAAFIRYCQGQTVTILPGDANSIFGVHADFVTNAPIKFCWECCTNTPAGPWWACSDTQMLMVDSTSTGTVTLGTNVAKGFVRFHGIS